MDDEADDDDDGVEEDMGALALDEVVERAVGACVISKTDSSLSTRRVSLVSRSSEVVRRARKMASSLLAAVVVVAVAVAVCCWCWCGDGDC